MGVTVKEIFKGDNGPSVEIHSDKFKNKFTVSKTEDGYAFFGIFVAVGTVPQELQGTYTTRKAAVEAVLNYEKNARVSKAVDRDAKAEARKARSKED